ncbi:methyltransferase domain-containing protein [Altericroceibacterium spongiae]|uniref:Methyltransferase domain-containing protein n=1 Tax=Altericroceibacterium spongiae TaxID=2320269 RepID=A0A420ES01_9SPHN|nr:methyltransferase domain-containing protein [Altericroceibacterium spongiae]RKF23506.1 methyltransferase domain-containing protein [Altericroceibacterium spongiae]
MSDQTPPRIFSPDRRKAIRQRAVALQARPDAAHFVLDDMVEDVIERLAFLRHEPESALIIGDWTGKLAGELAGRGCAVTQADPGALNNIPALDEEQPYPAGAFDLIVSLGTLDTVNDLPGALIHIREALADSGLAIASFPGAGSLPALRTIMMEADGDRPAARMHPMVDVRAGAQLLQRVNWASPVVDTHSIAVRYRSLHGLVDDIHAQGLGCALTSRAPMISREALERAEKAFAKLADNDGKVCETFEVLTLSGWKPKGGQFL